MVNARQIKHGTVRGHRSALISSRANRRESGGYASHFPGRITSSVSSGERPAVIINWRFYQTARMASVAEDERFASASFIQTVRTTRLVQPSGASPRQISGDLPCWSFLDRFPIPVKPLRNKSMIRTLVQSGTIPVRRDRLQLRYRQTLRRGKPDLALGVTLHHSGNRRWMLAAIAGSCADARHQSR